MTFGPVPRDEIPENSREQPEECANPKRRAPTVMDHYITNKNWGDSSSGPDAREDHTVRYAAFLRGDPLRHELVRRRIDDSLSGSEEKAHQNKEKHGAPDFGRQRGRQRREEPPPDNTNSKYSPRTEPIHQPSAGRLKQGVTQQKGTEHPPKPHLAEVVFLRQRTPRNRN